jgi:amidohydrolase
VSTTTGRASTPADEMTVEARVRARVEDAREGLVGLSRAIHAEPELAFGEDKASRRVAELLEAAGFTVECGVAGLATALTATYGSGELTVGICAEYDALPEIGHACGHNVIAAAGVGAALGLAEVADELGIRVKLIGTPAEEHGGGKVLLLDRGVFDDVTVAMMVHPGPHDSHPRDVTSQAVSRFAVTFTGQASHAAAAPQRARNAADAAVIAQVAIGLLRQQLSSECRVGLFVREGGQVTNIIPERTVVECEVRAFDADEFAGLRERVVACFEAGAHATGTDVSIEPTEPDYAPLRQDPRLADLYAEAIERTGRSVGDREPLSGGSTDMGNVSQALSSIHPMIAILGSEHAPHTRGFAAEAATAAADNAVVDGALALAWTGTALAGDRRLRRELVDEHTARGRSR